MEVRGLVLDEFGEPLEFAHAYYVDPFGTEYQGGPATVANGNELPGMFVLPFIVGGRIAVSHLGYETEYVDVYEPIGGGDVLNLVFNMVVNPNVLPEVVITPESSGTGSGILLALVAAVLILNNF